MKWLLMSAAAGLLGLVSVGSAKADHVHRRGHWDYHPTQVEIHRGHLHVRPGHFDYHRGSHYRGYDVYGGPRDHGYRSSYGYPGGSYYSPTYSGGRSCGY